MKTSKIFFAILITFLIPFTGFGVNHFTESFSGGPSNYYTGSHTFSSGLIWDLASIRGESASNSVGGVGGAARFLISTTSYIISPSVNTLESITFQYRELNAVGGGIFKVQKSVGGGSFVDIATQNFSGNTYQTFTLSVNDNSSDVKIKIVGINNSSYLIVDELTLTAVSTDPVINTSISSLTGFNYIFGSGPSASQSFNLTGSNLTGAPGNILITAPSNYEVSSDNITFLPVVNLAYSGTTISSTPIYARLKTGLPVNNYNLEIVSITGGGAPQIDFSLSGSVSAPPPPSLSLNPITLSGFTYIIGSGPSASQTYNISGSYLTGYPSDIVITASTNYEISLNNIAFTTSINLPYTSSTITSTPVYVRLISGLAVGSYNSEVISNSGGSASTVNVTCNGNVTAIPPASINISSSSLNGFVYFTGSGPSASQNFNITGNNLTGFPDNIIITAPLNYEISNDNITFSTSTSIPYSSSNLSSTTIFVRLKSGLAIAVYNSEIITITGGGANNTVTCNGEVKALSVSCATELIISEYHEPLAGNNKGIEIYNGTGQNVDLSNYYFGVIVNGGTDIESSQVLLGILGDKQTVCVYNDADADPNFRLKGDINIPWTSATWNGDDAIYLLKGGATKDFIIDAIGDLPPVTDPGSEFVNNGVSTLNTGLIRKSIITAPATIWSGLEWDVVTAGTYSDWGIHTMDCPSNIDNNTVLNEINLFPNPNNGNFSISTTKNLDDYSIKIANVFGATVFESDFFQPTIKVKLEPGLYILKIFNKQESLTKRFIVF